MVALAAAMPTAAWGAEAFTVGTATDAGAGLTPNLAVDAAGTGHFAYSDHGASPEVVQYCRVPRGTTACDATVSFGPVGGDANALFGTPFVFASPPAEVDIVYHRCCGDALVAVSHSENGGSSFDAREPLTTGTPTQPDDIAAGPGPFFSWIQKDGAQFQQGSPATPATAIADLFTAGQAHAATVGLSGAISVAVFQDFAGPQAEELLWRKYDGTGSRNDAGNWTAAQPVTAPIGYLTEARLAEGPNGLFLASIEGPSIDERLVVRKFLGNGFGPATAVSTDDVDDIDLHQDPSGRLHAVWGTDGSGSTNGVLRWATSTDGVTWSAAATLHVGESHIETRVAAAPDGHGFVVWDNAARARAIPLEPLTGPGGPVDNVRPIVTNFRAAPNVFRLGSAITPLTAKVAKGTTLKWTQSEGGTARVRILKLVRGVKKKSKGKVQCVRLTAAVLKHFKKATKLTGKALKKALDKRLCFVPAKGTKMSFARAYAGGPVQMPFTGRTTSRKLGPGRHRAVVTVRDGAGNGSIGKFTDFTVLGPAKKKK